MIDYKNCSLNDLRLLKLKAEAKLTQYRSTLTPELRKRSCTDRRLYQFREEINRIDLAINSKKR